MKTFIFLNFGFCLCRARDLTHMVLLLVWGAARRGRSCHHWSNTASERSQNMISSRIAGSHSSSLTTAVTRHAVRNQPSRIAEKIPERPLSSPCHRWSWGESSQPNFELQKRDPPIFHSKSKFTRPRERGRRRSRPRAHVLGLHERRAAAPGSGRIRRLLRGRRCNFAATTSGAQSS